MRLLIVHQFVCDSYKYIVKIVPAKFSSTDIFSQDKIFTMRTTSRNSKIHKDHRPPSTTKKKRERRKRLELDDSYTSSSEEEDAREALQHLRKKDVPETLKP